MVLYLYLLIQKNWCYIFSLDFVVSMLWICRALRLLWDNIFPWLILLVILSIALTSHFFPYCTWPFYYLILIIGLKICDLSIFYFDYRIEKIESSEIHRKFETLQRKQITLVDGDGVKLKFFLWGEQILLANLFRWIRAVVILLKQNNSFHICILYNIHFLGVYRVGSMLALDKPYVNSSVDCDTETCKDLCLEYGSETQLYLVPYIQHEEQVIYGFLYWNKLL